jgi:lysophospholipase L1-like esterase
MISRATLSIVGALVLVLALVGTDLLVLAQHNPNTVLAKPHYYMALGDSLTFGYQPNLNFTDGFADKVFASLNPASASEEINYACAGETTTTMIQGGCIARYLHHGSYTGPQLDAAVEFLQDHPGQVSPVTLEMGANDVLPDWHEGTCGPDPNSVADLAKMDDNLTKTILPRLTQALSAGTAGMGGMGGMAATAATNVRSGDLVMLNYYNPFAQECPDSAGFVHTFNQHLAADAAQFGVPIVDVYAAFGGDAQMATNVCTGQADAQGVHRAYTWICNAQFKDYHPTTDGYSVMASAVELALGYPGGPSVPGVVPMGRLPLPVAYRPVRRSF